MKKKLILGVAVVVVLCTIAIILVIRNNSNASNTNNKVTVDNKPKWSANKYINGKDPSSKVTHTAKEVDIDPESVTVLVNKEYKIAKDYKPSDLVEPQIKFSFNYKDEKRKLRKEAAQNLELLFQGAKYCGYELLGVSGFRSYERQKDLYEFNLLKYGYEYTQEYSAMPGTSEHQTGLSIDISCKSMKGLLRSSFGDTKEGKWVQDNAYKYGYIVRYPKNKIEVTGYGYEPWHIRYVGYDLAKFLYDNNMTLDEYYEYKLNIDLIDREQYAYYDDILTQKNGNNITYSEAVLDDIVDKSDVSENTDISNEDEEEDKKTEPNDIMQGLDQTLKPTAGNDEAEDELPQKPEEKPEEKPLDKPIQSQKPIIVPSKKPVVEEPQVSMVPEDNQNSEENKEEPGAGIENPKDEGKPHQNIWFGMN